MKRSLWLVPLCLSFFYSLALAAQDEAPPDDPLLQQFAAINKLIRQGHPAEAERMLDGEQFRSNQGKFKVGDLMLSAYAFSSTLLIGAYMDLNDYASAERIAKDRATWAEKQYGRDAFQVGGMLGFLADIERLQGKYGEAEPLFLRALSIHHSLKLDDCLIAKGIYTGLAETYIATNRAAFAERLLSPVIEACREKYGEKGMGRSDLLNELAVALEYDNEPDQAAVAASEADRVAIGKPRFQQYNRDFIRARLLAAGGHADDAVSYCRKWIGIFEEPDGPEPDRRLIQPLAECERFLRFAGRTGEAAQFGKRLNEIRKKYDGR